MKIKGIHHIKLSVSDLERSKDFYNKLPGFKIVAEHPDFVMFHNGNFYLGLTTHNGKVKGIFDEETVGMDHVSFEVVSIKELNECQELLERENITHGKIKKLSNDVFVLAFRDPDNIQLEFSCRN